MGACHGKKGPGKASGGDGQLNAPEHADAGVKLQGQHAVVKGMTDEAGILWEGRFQSVGDGAFTVQLHQGFHISPGAAHVTQLRGEDTVSPLENGVRAVVVKSGRFSGGGGLASAEQDQNQDQTHKAFHASTSTSKIGKLRVKVVPVGGVWELATVMLPPFRSTMSRTMARPKPLPPV